MERSYADDTNLLRSVQVALVVLAIIGTGLLIRYFDRLVIRPVGALHAGIQRMAGNDLAVRLPVTSDDELGGLATGFNHMAEHLEASMARWNSASRPRRTAWPNATASLASSTT